MDVPPPVSGERPRLPYPNGWFAVAYSDELPPGKVLRRRFMGDDVVLYRTRGGTARVVTPYCPHLGAHLGYGGSVEGEHLVCPFHHFAFDTSGACIRTGYGTPPPKARLGVLTSHEVNGAIMLWRHAHAEPPSWWVPAAPTHGFPAPVRHAYTIIDHPQELVENAVDLGHFGPVHHYSNPRVRHPLSFDGPRLYIGPAAERALPVIGAVDVEFDVAAHGLGYLFVTAEIPRLSASVLFQMMATPIDPVRMVVRFTVSARVGRREKPASQLATALSGLMTRGLSPLFWRDIRLDFPIWENKVYLEQPRLAKGDGPVMRYRRWAGQFYSAVPGEQDVSAPSVGPGRRHRAIV